MFVVGNVIAECKTKPLSVSRACVHTLREQTSSTFTRIPVPVIARYFFEYTNSVADNTVSAINLSHKGIDITYISVHKLCHFILLLKAFFLGQA